MKIFGKDRVVKKGWQMIFLILLLISYISVFWHLIYWFVHKDTQNWNPTDVVFIDSILMCIIFVLFAAYLFYNTFKEYTEQQKRKIQEQYNKKIDELDNELKRLKEK